MLPGEIVGNTVTTCTECGTELTLGVYRSAAGYYLGFFCPQDGPYSSEESAARALESGSHGR